VICNVEIGSPCQVQICDHLRYIAMRDADATWKVRYLCRETGVGCAISNIYPKFMCVRLELLHSKKERAIPLDLLYTIGAHRACGDGVSRVKRPASKSAQAAYNLAGGGAL
jgi:hypothetical protein